MVKMANVASAVVSAAANASPLYRILQKENLMGSAAFITCPHCKKDSHVGHFDWVSLFCVHCQKEVNLNDWLISVGRAVQLRVHLTASGAGGRKHPAKAVKQIRKLLVQHGGK